MSFQFRLLTYKIAQLLTVVPIAVLGNVAKAIVNTIGEITLCWEGWLRLCFIPEVDLQTQGLVIDNRLEQELPPKPPVAFPPKDPQDPNDPNDPQ